MHRALPVCVLAALAVGATTVSGQEMPPTGQPSEEKPGLPRPTQRILINKQITAGDLTLFQDKDDDKVFYYLPDKPQIAQNGGVPELSFLRWVKNDPNKPEGDGGGVFTAAIRMGVSPEQLQRARAEIQGVKPGARIAGPVMFSSGTFGVSFTTGGTTNKPAQIIGLGKAPLLDGQTTSVTLELDRHASQVLWETFKTAKPAIDFHFEMEMTGLHQPYKATLTADWDKIYKHTAFDAGIAHRYLGAEIHLAFEELRQSGAIKLDQEGKDDGWDARIQSAYNILASMMFDRTVSNDPNAAVMPMPADGSGDAEKKGLYERAVTLLANARSSAESARAKNAEIRARNKAVRERNAAKIAMNEKLKASGEARKKLEAAQKALTAAESTLSALEKEVSGKASPELQKKLADAEKAVKELEGGSGTPAPTGGGGAESAELKKAREDLAKAVAAAGEPGKEYLEALKKYEALSAKTEKSDAEKSELKTLEKQLKSLKEQGAPVAAAYAKVSELEKKAGGVNPPKAVDPKKLQEAKDHLEAVRKEVADAAKPTADQQKKIAAARAEVDRWKKEVDVAKAAAGDGSGKELELEKEEPEIAEDSVPPFAVLASFQMKRERRSGKFRIDLNKFTASSATQTFRAGCGDVRSLFNTNHFKMVNLDDPLYKQRDVVAYVDGDLNATDFGRYVNYVTVQLRKTHAKGDVTDQQVRVDKTTFTGGNNFKMLYGWKDDNDRRRWLEYEYRTVWSFFGGRQVEFPWRKSQEASIPLAPPFMRRVVDVDISPDLVEKEGLRAVTLKVFYDLGAGEQVKQMTLNTFRKDSPLSGQLEFMLPVNQPEYAYEVTYQVKGNRTVSSGRERTSSGALILEELPRR